MKNILVLNGSPRKKGKTNKLVNTFLKGAQNNHIDHFHLYDMEIRGCRGCESCRWNDTNNPCVQKDDMHQIYESFNRADVIVFASPIYFWTVTGPLKTAVDR